jgi:wobble nucleotide-excising tRNase
MSKQTINSNISLVEAIMIHLKGGDDKKVLRFAERLKKYYKNQIAARNTRIDELEDQLADSEEALEELKVNINIEAISNAQDLDGYCAVYVETLHAKRREIAKIKQEIASEKKDIETLEELSRFNFTVPASK